MTYHVYCPISKKNFDFESVPHARRFVLGMMKRFPKCRKNITIRDGNVMVGRMKRIGSMVVWKSVNMRKGRIVMEDGTLGAYIEVNINNRRKPNGKM